jgi:hypothetical protein
MIQRTYRSWLHLIDDMDNIQAFQKSKYSERKHMSYIDKLLFSESFELHWQMYHLERMVLIKLLERLRPPNLTRNRHTPWRLTSGNLSVQQSRCLN